MRTLPGVADHGGFDALVIRTDYHDEAGWLAVVTELGLPWGDRRYESLVHFVDDPAWADATADEVAAEVRSGENPSVVFLADRTTMRSAPRTLLAVTAVRREDGEDQEEDGDYALTTRYGRSFRTLPTGVHEIHANLSIANMGFEEFARAAQDDPDGIFRSF
ncbi:hypothetical protein ACFC1T_30665 [Kitasatospora sp. NPDC056076]|uniref:DUF6924 domain-containing protein n=1 Tax=Kitasatospora sp. NPDC056076 TaxID=3345703 RepID=UPI0035E2C424